MRDAALGVRLLTVAVLGISSGTLSGGLLARAQSPEPGHAIADKFAREAGKADKDAQRRAADAKRKADAEKKKSEDARRKAEEAEMLGIARAEAEARRLAQEQARVELEAEEARLIAEAQAAEAAKAAEATRRAEAERRAEDERRIAEAKAAEEARITAALEAQRAREDAERRQAEAKAAEVARQAAARAAEEEARRIAETLAAARAREEAQRMAAAEARRIAELPAAAELDKRREAERQQAMAAEREAEAQRVSERLREARQSRQEQARSVEAPIEAPVVADSQPVGHGSPASDAPGRTGPPVPLPERVTVLMLLEPGDRGIRRHNKTADPLLCNGQGCYVSNGPATEAAFLPGRRALGFGRTFGGRAGACSNRLGCVFRNVEYAAIAGLVQPIDMRVMRHDRREPTTLDGVSDCVASKARLACRRTIETGSYVLWIVPEALAEAVGPDLLEQALADGLPRSEQAALPPSWR